MLLNSSLTFIYFTFLVPFQVDRVDGFFRLVSVPQRYFSPTTRPTSQEPATSSSTSKAYTSNTFVSKVARTSTSLLLLLPPEGMKSRLGEYREEDRVGVDVHRWWQTQRTSSTLSSTTTTSLQASSVKSDNDEQSFVTILGFGSLLSETSSRLTFPDLKNFRLGRVPGYRRVFAHPASIFFQRGIADLPTKRMSSLSVEKDVGNYGFIVSVFEVAKEGLQVDAADNSIHEFIPSQAFLEREEEFNIVPVPYLELDVTDSGFSVRHGIICTRSTDEAYIERWGQERFENHFLKYGVNTIWGWDEDSELLPCSVYLRHCYLASKSMGESCLESFLDETFLVDRKTPIRTYLEEHPEVLETEPPADLLERYSG